MNTHDFYMKEAIKQGEMAFQAGEVPVGAVLVYQDKIIARSYNQREKKQSPIAHAEMLVIEEGASFLKNRRLKDCVLYVTLEPCPMCAGALIMAQVKACYFGAYDEKQGCCGSVYMIPQDPVFYHQTNLVGGIMEKECRDLLQRFFIIKREERN